MASPEDGNTRWRAGFPGRGPAQRRPEVGKEDRVQRTVTVPRLECGVQGEEQRQREEVRGLD